MLSDIWRDIVAHSGPVGPAHETASSNARRAVDIRLSAERRSADSARSATHVRRRREGVKVGMAEVGMVKARIVKVEMAEVRMVKVEMAEVVPAAEEKSRPRHNADEWDNEQRTVVRKIVNRRIGRICRNGRIIPRRRSRRISR
jgi:hypothetical protein